MSTGASRSIASSQDVSPPRRRHRAGNADRRRGGSAGTCRRRNAEARNCNDHSRGRAAALSRSARVADDAAKIEPPSAVEAQASRAWKLAGTPRKRLDVFDKVTGQPIYAIDVRLPDMLYAAIVQCPVFGGALKSVDDDPVKAMKGVRRVVRMPDAVAVVADSWWRAKQAAKALRVTWDDRGNAGLSTAAIRDFVRDGLDATRAQVGRADGDAAAALGARRAPHRGGL